MAEVLLHVYDVTNSLNVKANTAIVQLNKLMRDGMGVGGIFHGAIQVCLSSLYACVSLDGLASTLEILVFLIDRLLIPRCPDHLTLRSGMPLQHGTAIDKFMFKAEDDIF
jgi:hypothetical protein